VIITKLQVAPVELDVSSSSSCAVRLARHSQNAWARHVECVESSQVEFELWSPTVFIHQHYSSTSSLHYGLSSDDQKRCMQRNTMKK